MDLIYFKVDHKVFCCVSPLATFQIKYRKCPETIFCVTLKSKYVYRNKQWVLYTDAIPDDVMDIERFGASAGELLYTE